MNWLPCTEAKPTSCLIDDPVDPVNPSLVASHSSESAPQPLAKKDSKVFLDNKASTRKVVHQLDVKTFPKCLSLGMAQGSTKKLRKTRKWLTLIITMP